MQLFWELAFHKLKIDLFLSIEYMCVSIYLVNTTLPHVLKIPHQFSFQTDNKTAKASLLDETIRKMGTPISNKALTPNKSKVAKKRTTTSVKRLRKSYHRKRFSTRRNMDIQATPQGSTVVSMKFPPSLNARKSVLERKVEQFFKQFDIGNI